MFETCNNCWFGVNCPEKTKQTDEKVCAVYAHMLNMFINSNIPKVNWVKTDLFLPDGDTDVERIYQLSKNMEKFYREPTSVLIWSEKYLNGKTHWVFRMLQEYMTLWTNLQFNDHLCVYYIHASEFFEKYKNQVDNKDAFIEVIAKMKSAELLAVDDIDILIGKDKVQEALAEVLTYRYTKQLSNIFTSHVSPPELKVKLVNNYLINKAIDVSEPYEFTTSQEEIKSMIEGDKDGE